MKLFKWLQIKIFGIDIWPIIRWFKKRKNMNNQKFMTGKLPAKHDPKNRTLKMAKYMVNVPDPPESFSNLDIIYNNLHITDPAILFPIDGNDVYGDCVVAGAAHYLTLEHGRIGQKVIPLDRDVIKLYKKLSGCKDRGLVMFDFLKYWRTHPLFGHKIELFGRIELHNHKLVKQCIQLFGGVDLGFLVQNDAIKDFDSGTPWTPGPSDGGGHCVIAAAYDKDYYYILTWGGIIRATKEWWDQQVDESFAILPTEFIEPGFAQGFDSDQLQKDFAAITS
jgi:hypothetical protein